MKRFKGVEEACIALMKGCKVCHDSWVNTKDKQSWAYVTFDQSEQTSVVINKDGTRAEKRGIEYFTIFDNPTEWGIYEEPPEWYEHIPKDGTLIYADGKVMIATKYLRTRHEVLTAHGGRTINVDNVRPLSNEELLELMAEQPFWEV
jgi:hypothetical protein